MHVRFFNPVAQETARRAYGALVARGVVPPIKTFISHKARRGDTLGKLSKRYGVSVVAIRRANRLRSNRIFERRSYLIPVARPRPGPAAHRLTFPPRRLPPPRGPEARTAKGDKVLRLNQGSTVRGPVKPREGDGNECP
jgi:penicillin-insensitive murein endopeptidase